MKTLFVILLTIGSQLTLAQGNNLIAVPGTKCSLVPPKGFVPAINFSGFQNASIGASIIITEIPASYETLLNSFTKEALLSKGMSLVSKQPADFSQGKATMIHVTQQSGGTSYIKHILLFGKNNTTVIVNGIYPEANKDAGPEIKKAMLSTVYNIDQQNDSLAAAIFTIDAAGTDFKFTKYMSGALVYTVDGKIPTEGALLVVAPSFNTIPAARQKKYAEDRIKTLPRGEQTVIKEINEISIDHMKGYEIIADGLSKSGAPALVYQAMLFDETGQYYVISGEAATAHEKYLIAFRKIAQTFKRK